MIGVRGSPEQDILSLGTLGDGGCPGWGCPTGSDVQAARPKVADFVGAARAEELGMVATAMGGIGSGKCAGSSGSKHGAFRAVAAGPAATGTAGVAAGSGLVGATEAREASERAQHG